MLSEKYKENCYEHIEGSVHYCNGDLKVFKGNELSIDYSIIDSMEFNANSSVFDDKTYKLKMNSEVFEKTFHILNTLLYKENINFYRIISGGEKTYNSEKANLYLDLMHAISTRLIIFHELGHIYNGHLDYYQTFKTGAQGLSLFLNSSENQLPPLESQVLEMDADAFAATRIIGQFTFSPNIEAYNKIIPDLFKHHIHSLILVIISSCITFSIMGLGRKREPGDYLSSKYLPLRTRQDYFVRCALNAYKILNDDQTIYQESELLDINFYREVLFNVEQYVNLYYQEALGIHKDDMNSSNNKNELDEVLIKHADFLEDFWSIEMRSKLLPFAHLGLAY
ncbi:hypothetical protein [Paenibacillus sp. sgz5001063]|uniref:hypothetical protein n=1 Tax=Paenibacillus sp. sgz5001063 TaxID=3242474 RepID=UPI0036D3A340